MQFLRTTFSYRHDTFVPLTYGAKVPREVSAIKHGEDPACDVCRHIEEVSLLWVECPADIAAAGNWPQLSSR